MNPLLSCTATLAVSAIFCLWQTYCMILARRQKQQRERVAYLLWTLAMRDR
jgi:hypothetical protein